MARIVLTHSTYIKGLIVKLKILAKYTAIQTITPGEIKRTKGRGGKLKLKLATSIRGGYKLLARRGNSVQEVFIVTKIQRDKFEEIITKYNQI